MTVMDEVNSQLHSLGRPHQLPPSTYVRLVLSRIPAHVNFLTQLIWFVYMILTLSFATPFHFFSVIWLPNRPVAQLLLEVYLHMCVLGLLASFLTFPRKSLDTYWEQFPKFEDLDTIWVSKFQLSYSLVPRPLASVDPDRAWVHLSKSPSISSTFAFVQPRAYILMHSRFFLTTRRASVIKKRCARSEWSR
jgi:hypothetical protein